MVDYLKTHTYVDTPMVCLILCLIKVGGSFKGVRERVSYDERTDGSLVRTLKIVVTNENR